LPSNQLNGGSRVLAGCRQIEADSLDGLKEAELNAMERVEVPETVRKMGVVAKDAKNDLANLIGILMRRWRLMTAAIALFLLLGVLALFVFTPLYTAKNSILLDPKRNAALDMNAAMAGMSIDVGFVESEVAVISSFNIARRVVEKMSLDKDAEFSGGTGGLLTSAFGAIRRIFSSKAAVDEAPELKLPPEVRTAIDRLRANTLVRRNGLTYVIDVSITTKDPVKSASIANAMAEAYLVDRLEARYTAAKRATTWLNDRLAGLKQAVEVSEREAGDYRAKNGLVSTNSGTVEKQQLSEINGQLVLARAKTAETRAKLEQAQRVSSSGGSIASLGDVLASPLISSLRGQEAEVGRREADLSTRYGPSHPQVVTVRAELSDIRRGIAGEVQRVVTNLRNEFDVAQKREKSLQDSLDRISGLANRNDNASIKLRELEREADSNRQLYESFLGKFKEAREQTTLETTESRVISPAVAPHEASFPRRGPVLSVAMILGLFAGIGAAFAMESLSNGFQTSEQVDEAISAPTLAMLPSVGSAELDELSGDLGLLSHIIAKPFSRFAEGIRSIRTGVLLSNLDRPPKVIMVCSTVPNEGKSTLAACFAASAAQAGRKVLLMDGDLRNPSTTNRFSLGKHPGIVELLSGSVPPQSAFAQPAGIPMTILPAGAHTTNPTDVISSQKMAQLLQLLAKQYDLIVIDCPPILAVSDALLMANIVDSIVYVVEWNRTARDAVKRAMRMLGPNAEKLAGVVLNKVNESKMKTYSYYGEYYGYGYDNYYTKK
jgi:polysaccharide biosynthesis transport protein